MKPALAASSFLSPENLYLFNEGTHFNLYEQLGSHRARLQGVEGFTFAVWAPNARSVSVVGDFNRWNQDASPLDPQGQSGIWAGFVPGLEKGAPYKYHLIPRDGASQLTKADPFANFYGVPPHTFSRVWDLEYQWKDIEWMASRRERQKLDEPWSIYELHLGSWTRVPEEQNRSLTYAEIGPKLVDYLQRMNFTHVEFLPVMEHPFFGSWGYQTTGYFAPTSRFGTPQDFMALIDLLHQNGLGVILDWVPSHFPADEHGLASFDGTYLFEHEDPRQRIHPDWKTHIFNYGRPEVRGFLISSACFWLEKFHADALRMDGVASMLYLDYSRRPGQWVPNKNGGRENLEAIDFIRRLNQEIYRRFPDVQTIAEESTAWPMVSKPIQNGGLGFGYKWDMGWAHDTLLYFSNDPLFRKHHQQRLTFRGIYAFSETFILPLSHDEASRHKGSLLAKMPGNEWTKFANLRLLYGYMHAQPGKKLIFMGGEFGQWKEWDHDSSLDWHLVQAGSLHAKLQRWVGELNHFYRREPALHQTDSDPAGFEWIDCHDAELSTLSWLRKSDSTAILAVFNFTPVSRHNYRIGVPAPGFWKETLNSDAEEYGGSGQGNLGGVEAAPFGWHSRSYSLTITLPPLSALFFRQPERLPT